MSVTSIIYLCYNEEPYNYLERMFDGVKKQTNKDSLRLVIVYNPGSADKSKVIDFIKTKIEINKKDLPLTVFLPQEKNIGFVGGNNKGIEWVLTHPLTPSLAGGGTRATHPLTPSLAGGGSDYVFLHNGDGFLDENAISKITNQMDKDDKVGCAQAMVLMYPDISIINTSGNKINFLGLSYCGDYKKKLVDLPLAHPLTPSLSGGGIRTTHPLTPSLAGGGTRTTHPLTPSLAGGGIREVAFASGAAMMMRVDLLKQYGPLDKDFFIYLEDMEYCLRLKSLGYKTITVPEAIFFHQYEFSNKPTKYYYLERNRGIILLSYYKILTLLFIFPAWLVMELGIWFFAITKGWGKEKLKEYAFWLKKSSWRLVIDKRKNIQAERVVGDRELLSIMTDKIIFDDVDNWLLRYIANPFLKVYWKVVYWLVRW